MKKRSVSLLIIFSVALVVLVAGATGVEAGCKRLQPRGPYICADWITGSEECRLILKGLKGNLADDAIITCGVYGTYFGNAPHNTDLDLFDPSCDPSDPSYDPGLGCFIPGKAKCVNPDGHYNPNGNAFNLQAILIEQTENATCAKGGKCETSAVVDVTGGEFVCNNNWTLEGFTAERFFGEVCVCPGGYDDAGKCCLDSNRINDGSTCKTYYNEGEEIGTPDCLTEFCVYQGNFADYNFDTSMGGYACYETNPDN